jgi:hypothetical protein
MDRKLDKGLYQVYGHHPIYGRTLVYIGMTDQSFAARLGDPNNNWTIGSENDPDRVEFFVGRLIGSSTPDIVQWRKEIVLAGEMKATQTFNTRVC